MTPKEAYISLKESLESLYSIRESDNISKILLEDLFGKMCLVYNKPFSLDDNLIFDAAKDRLLRGEPLQYVVGFADFYGERFVVNNSVLIPRPETEELVYKILENHSDEKSLRVLDIGTGSGCIAIMLAKERPNWTVSAIDVSEGALDVANLNMEKNEVSIHFRNVDILNKSEWNTFGLFDIIVSNPPYIPNHEQNLMKSSVYDHEPSIALFVDDKVPLLFYKTIMDFSKKQINKGGSLYFECNEYNSSELLRYSKAKGHSDSILYQDLQGKDRMLKINY